MSMASLISSTLGALEVAASLSGIPGLSVAATLLREIADVCQQVSVNKVCIFWHLGCAISVDQIARQNAEDCQTNARNYCSLTVNKPLGWRDQNCCSTSIK